MCIKISRATLSHSASYVKLYPSLYLLHPISMGFPLLISILISTLFLIQAPHSILIQLIESHYKYCDNPSYYRNYAIEKYCQKLKLWCQWVLHLRKTLEYPAIASAIPTNPVPSAENDLSINENSAPIIPGTKCPLSVYS